MKTAKDLQRKLETKRAKNWGFKSIKDANDNGYNARIGGISIKDLTEFLSISRDDAYILMNEWKANGEIQFCQYANLENITFL